MKNQFYKAIIEPQEKGDYTAYIPKLPGCVSEGETYNETLKNIEEALKLYLEVMIERKQKVVKDEKMVVVPYHNKDLKKGTILVTK